MGCICDGSDPTAPVECGNSQHSPPTSLDQNISRLLQGPLASSSDFVQVSENSECQDPWTSTEGLDGRCM
jgi:hypothetical protein